MRRSILRRASALRKQTLSRQFILDQHRCATMRAPLDPPILSSRIRPYSTQSPQETQIPESLVSPGQAAPEDVVELSEWDKVSKSHPFRPPPQQRSRAEREGEVSDPSYVPATTYKNLKTVGGFDGWWDEEDNWLKRAAFVGFKPPGAVQEPVILEAAVRRALVEALTLRRAGQEDKLTSTWPLGGMKEMQRSLQVQLETSRDGAIQLVSGSEQVVDDLAQADDLIERTQELVEFGIENEESPQDGVEAVEDTVRTRKLDSAARTPTRVEALAYQESWDPNWKQISLADPLLKFAVTKRVFQLTGRRIPDAKLTDIHDVASLLSTLRKPKPKTLTKEIQQDQQEFTHLPNVAFTPKRVTRADKDTALGRNKLILAELRKRGLDVKLQRLERNQEKDWLDGGV